MGELTNHRGSGWISTWIQRSALPLVRGLVGPGMPVHQAQTPESLGFVAGTVVRQRNIHGMGIAGSRSSLSALDSG